MSQAKVDRYKEEKKNRKREVQKTKRQQRLVKVIVPIIVIVIAAWIIYSGVTFYQEQRPVSEVQVDLSAISDYMVGLYYL